jgi:uncharacterized membrane protein
MENMKSLSNKSSFMYELNWELLWKYDKKEAKDIIDDYEEYFELGLLDGKSEEDICKELGSPLDLVRAIFPETTKFRRYINKKILHRFILAFVMLSIITYLIVTLDDNKHMVLTVCLLTPFVIIGLWTLFGDPLYSLSWFSSSESKKNLSKLLVYHLFHTLLILSLFWFMKFEILTWGIKKSPFGMEMFEIGPFVTNILYGIIIILISLLFFGVHKYIKTSIYYFSIIVHEIGIIGTIICYMNTMYKIDESSKYKEYVNLDLLPYLISIVIGGFYILYGNKLLKEVK